MVTFTGEKQTSKTRQANWCWEGHGKVGWSLRSSEEMIHSLSPFSVSLAKSLRPGDLSGKYFLWLWARRFRRPKQGASKGLALLQLMVEEQASGSFALVRTHSPERGADLPGPPHPCKGLPPTTAGAARPSMSFMGHKPH